MAPSSSMVPACAAHAHACSRSRAGGVSDRRRPPSRHLYGRRRAGPCRYAVRGSGGAMPLRQRDPACSMINGGPDRIAAGARTLQSIGERSRRDRLGRELACGGGERGLDHLIGRPHMRCLPSRRPRPPVLVLPEYNCAWLTSLRARWTCSGVALMSPL
jgi:hypothetical protein